jgi:hypothetical protein
MFEVSLKSLKRDGDNWLSSVAVHFFFFERRRSKVQVFAVKYHNFEQLPFSTHLSDFKNFLTGL